MADGKEIINEAKNAIEEGKQAAADAQKIAAKAASGNYIGAAKDAIKSGALKKQIKKKLITNLIRTLIPLLIVVIMAASLFGVLNRMKNEMIQLFSNAKTSLTSFLSDVWKWFTDDYWIDLEEEMDYVVNVKTGETLGRKDADDGDYTDEEGNPVETEIQKYTIVDKYLKELGEKGMSTQSLRLLGNADYSFEDLLNDDTEEGKENKYKVEKYIAEFIRADIITQQPHRRRGDELVNPNDQNKIDGGVYFYRTQKEEQLKESDFPDGATKVEQKDIEITDKDYRQMEYMQPDEFMEYDGKTVDSGNIDKVRYSFSIDPDTGELLVAEIVKKETKESKILTKEKQYDFLNLSGLSKFLQETLNKQTEYTVTIKHMDYRSLISKYTMPYEFLINLCEITQNPEFVYHVALLARDTKIVLAIQDAAEINVEATLTETLEINKYINYSGPTVEGAEVKQSEPYEEMQTITTTTLTPVLRVEYADTWSWYEEFEFTKNIEGEITKGNPHEETYTPTANDFTHEDAHTDPQVVDGGMAGGEVTQPIEIPERWVTGEIVTRRRTTTETINTKTTYNEGKKVESIEKSKQFLGMLRNRDGQCEKDCFEENPGKHFEPEALECAENATFARQGYDVSYRIPNSTEYEAPLDKLFSGLDMLYAILQSNNKGLVEGNIQEDDETGIVNVDEENKDEQNVEDYENKYVSNMQGLVEHIKYLMTFPNNESYTVKDLTGVQKEEEENEEEPEEPPISSDFIWPLEQSVDCRISSSFGMRVHPILKTRKFHSGIDIAKNSYSVDGKPVLASAAGKVITAQSSSTAGNFIVIDHGNGMKTRYLHLKSFAVSVGQQVTQGQVIGYLGSTGRSTGPHLHFEIQVNDTAVDPLLYVRKPGSGGTSGSSAGGTGTSGNKTYSTLTTEQMDTLYAVVAQECASSYEGALAVISCILNRCDENWGKHGTNPYAQATADGQFCYSIDNNWKKYLNGNAPSQVKQAVDAALNGARNHTYTSFRTDSENARKKHPNGKSIGGNWYFT